MTDAGLIAKLNFIGCRGVVLDNGVLHDLSYAPRTLSIPSGVIALDTGCISGQKDLQLVILPPSIGRVGVGVFSNCPNLREIRVPVELQHFQYNLTVGTEAVLRCL